MSRKRLPWFARLCGVRHPLRWGAQPFYIMHTSLWANDTYKTTPGHVYGRIVTVLIAPYEVDELITELQRWRQAQIEFKEGQ